jgi:hypothetical protein
MKYLCHSKELVYITVHYIEKIFEQWPLTYLGPTGPPYVLFSYRSRKGTTKYAYEDVAGICTYIQERK